MGSSKGSRWIRRLCRISRRVTICSLPDDVLLDIFEFCLPDLLDHWYPQSRALAWSELVHVCQRWRYIVFASPLRLDLRLFCTDRRRRRPGTPVRKMLDIWPPLPINILYSSFDPQVEDNIIAALEHPNRVRAIMLSQISLPLEDLVAVMQEPFPELESLTLHKKWRSPTVPALPNTFLGGSAPRLRSLNLSGITFPTLPRLLLSSNDLVELLLYRIPHSGYISPEAMAMSISALTRLTRLSIEFISPASRPDPITGPPPPLTRAVLPVLTKFHFYGVSAYLEDLMARIEAPLLEVIKIVYFNQLVFDIQQLPRFISHAQASISCDTAYMLIGYHNVLMHFSSMRRPSCTEFLTFEILGRGVDWQVSSVVQICNQLSEFSFMSGIEELFIKRNPGSFIPLTWKDVMDETQWLELFHPFTSVRTLYISEEFHPHIVSALRGLSEETATEVLPALDNLYLQLEVGRGFGSAQQDIEPFIIARQRSGQPFSIHPWDGKIKT
ncbi:hypothetical protein BGW80DRAFT_182076 [Lactifluus volemus]|nr:hypothetical protein BGW80DRAFT_182076 [Lactifluus volemus]